MGRVLFPTKNEVGVRTMSGVAGADYDGFRAPAEPAPRGASNPVTLGVAVSTAEFLPSRTYWGGDPIIYRPPLLPAPSPMPVAPGPIVVAQPFPPVVPAPVPAPPVSQQSTPTPVVTIPPAQPTPPLVTSGGGTTSPNIAPAAAAAPAPTGFMDSVAAWLSGSTAIGTWSVPNALLAGAVILGFAFLEGGGSSTGRKR